jgi:hypothetical protein
MSDVENPRLAIGAPDDLIAEPPATGYAKASAVAAAVLRLPAEPTGTSATDALSEMREDERQ